MLWGLFVFLQLCGLCYREQSKVTRMAVAELVSISGEICIQNKITQYYIEIILCDVHTSGTPRPQHNCELKKKTVRLQRNDCESVEPVEIATCSGSCGSSESRWASKKYTVKNYVLGHAKRNKLLGQDSFSWRFTTVFIHRYSAMTNSLLHSCRCCRDVSTTNKTVEMTCAKGKKETLTYTLVTKCGCQSCLG